MSWDAVFADLQEQFRAAARREVDEEIPHLAEAELAGIGVADRIRARGGQHLTVQLRDGSRRTGMVQEATPSWLRLADGPRRLLIPLAAVGAAWPLHTAAPEAGPIEKKMSLGHVLRALAQQRLPVLVRAECGEHRGVVARVGADHLDLLEDRGDPQVLTILWQGLLSIEST